MIAGGRKKSAREKKKRLAKVSLRNVVDRLRKRAPLKLIDARG